MTRFQVRPWKADRDDCWENAQRTLLSESSAGVSCGLGAIYLSQTSLADVPVKRAAARDCQVSFDRREEFGRSVSLRVWRIPAACNPRVV